LILIDQSAGSRDLILYPPLDNPSLAALTSLSLSPDTKSSVDIQFTGQGPDDPLTIVIEFKSLSDLLSSIFTGRIQDTQIPAMREQGDICWLLFYGDYRCGEDGNLETPNPPIFKKKEDRMFYWAHKGSYNGPFISRSEAYEDYCDSQKWSSYDWIGNKPLPFSYLESSLLSYSAAGISHKHFSTISDCAQWIYTLYKWWSRPFNSHKSFRVFDRTSDNRRPAIMGNIDPVTRTIMDFADRIPGIDFTLAKSIASHFSSVQEMVNAPESEWVKIDGIGKVKARIAVETMTREKRKEEIDRLP
jgi:hypothetical protein